MNKLPNDLKRYNSSAKGIKLISEKDYKQEIFKATFLIDISAYREIDEDEMGRILLYYLIIYYAKKFKLNWKLAYKELGINKLIEKYSSDYITKFIDNFKGDKNAKSRKQCKKRNS